MERTGAVILAAGLSSRMHEFKPLLELGDSTIIVRAIENLKTAGASPVIIVAGYKADQLMDYLWPLDIMFVRKAGDGMSGRSGAPGLRRPSGPSCPGGFPAGTGYLRL